MLIEYVYIYIVISLFFLIVNAFISGFNYSTWNKHDFIDSILWVLSLSVLLGLGLRLLYQKLQELYQKGNK